VPAFRLAAVNQDYPLRNEMYRLASCGAVLSDLLLAGRFGVRAAILRPRFVVGRGGHSHGVERP